MLLKNKDINHIFYQEKDTTKKKKAGVVAFPFKVDGKVVFFEQFPCNKKKLDYCPLDQVTMAASFYYTFKSAKNVVASACTI